VLASVTALDRKFLFRCQRKPTIPEYPILGDYVNLFLA
jgi:hypothetical protein